MIGIKVSGLGKAVPKRKLSNEELCTLIDSSDEWITSRTGIHARHIAEEETTTDLAAAAARVALGESGLSQDEIDLVIVATVSPDHTMPSIACKTAALLGIHHASCFDLTAACSGFVYATQVAYSLIQTGFAQNALVIGAETLSRVVDLQDRSTCILFGDGAGAVVYEKTEEDRLLAIQTGSYPEGSGMITLPTMTGEAAFSKRDSQKATIHMEGKAVYCFATTKVPRSIQEVLAAAHLAVEDVDWFVLHQANTRIMDAVAKKLQVDPEKFFKNISEYGNTSAASIPMALYDLRPHLKPGDKIILSGFGAGLTWGTMLFEW